MAEQNLELIRSIAKLEATLAALDQKIDVAHKRVDKIENEISADLNNIWQAVQPLRDYMNRAKGGLAVLLSGAALLGGIVVKAADWFVGKH